MDANQKDKLNKLATQLRSKENLSPAEIADRLKIDKTKWRFKSRGGGRVSLEAVEQRQKAKSSYERRRQHNIRMSTSRRADMTKTTLKTIAIRNKGMEADHIAPVARSGNGLRDKTPAERGRMRANFRRANIPLGDDPRNIQALTREANIQKDVDYRRLDQHLQKLSTRPMTGGVLAPQPSAPVVPKKLPTRAAMTALAGAGVVGLGPLGTAASAAEVAGRSQIAQASRNPVDRIQAGIAGFSAAADVASYAPPVTAPATLLSTGADILNMGIDVTRNFIDEIQRLRSLVVK